MTTTSAQRGKREGTASAMMGFCFVWPDEHGVWSATRTAHMTAAVRLVAMLQLLFCKAAAVSAPNGHRSLAKGL